MKKAKTISITLTEPNNLIVPEHLKGQNVLDVKVDGFNDIEAIQMLISVLAGLTNQYKSKVDSLT